jgi:ATP-dependent helicase/nuclease subunit A
VAQAIAQLVREEGVPAERIFVLARRRASLVLAARALAACGVPHVAPEDWRLAELSPVQDLLAVMDVLASPSQSLSLARFLKSPLIGADDDDLQALAQVARSGPCGPVPWFEALCQRCPARPALGRARELLLRWRATAAVWPPHDLLQQIVDDSDALGRLAATAPPSQAALVAPAIEALLAVALALDEGRFVTLYGFVRALRQRSVKAPAGMAPGAVQLLTIHGAKGLEAHTVFVMDADPERQNAEQSTVLTDWPVDAAAPRRLAFVASESQPPKDWQDHVETERQARAREEANALYVAITRAETQLVFSRTEAYNKPSAPSWWARVQALGACVELPPTPVSATPTASERTVSVPAWPDVLSRPLAVAEVASDEDRTAAIGRAVHRVLEWATSGRGAVAADEISALSAAAAKAFGAADADEVQRVVRAILASPECAPFFDGARLTWAGNEVPVRGADGQVLRIDRLVQMRDIVREPDSVWWVLDYKLSGDPLHNPEMREQLRSYCDAVRLMEPGARVRGAFITQTGALQVMDAA